MRIRLRQGERAVPRAVPGSSMRKRSTAMIEELSRSLQGSIV
jgi:hypothetical protein